MQICRSGIAARRPSPSSHDRRLWTVAIAVAIGAAGCASESPMAASQPLVPGADTVAALLVIDADPRDTVYQRSFNLHGHVEGNIRPDRLEMLIDSGTARQHTVTGESGEYMTFPDFVKRAPFNWSIDALDTIGEGAHDVVVHLYDAAGRRWSARSRYVSAVPARPYTMSALQALGGDAAARGVNGLGDAAGWALDEAGRRHAVVWHGGQLATMPVPDSLDAWANAINDRGDVVGAVATRGEECVRPALWTAGVLHVITDLPTSACQPGEAIAVNDSGTVLVASLGYGYLFGPSGITNLPFDYPFALNNNGQVVGQSHGNDAAYAAGWNITFSVPAYLPYGIGHPYTAATGLNDREEVIGNSRGRPYFVKAGQSSIDLMPYLGWTSPVAINDSGTVLAFDERANAAFLWENDRVARVTLAPSEWVLIDVRAINDAGQITGSARSRVTGKISAVLIEPVGR